MSTRNGKKRKRIKSRKVICLYPLSKDATEEQLEKVRDLSRDLLGFDARENYSSGGGEQQTGGGEGRRNKRLFRVAIDENDFKSLKPGCMLKGSIINFFVKHLDYGHGQDKDASIETLSTEFYKKLFEDGPRAVLNWQHIDPFQRKIINMPLCVGNHWRLIVLMNPKSVLDRSPIESGRPLCCILGFDCQTGDSRLVRSKAPVIREWLSLKWNQAYPEAVQNPFDKTMPSHAPSVPKEPKNVNECGIHTMLALRMMYKLRGESFLCGGDSNDGGTTNPWFTKSFRKVCGYGPHDVIQLRKDTEIFIRRYSDYQKEVEPSAVTESSAGHESDESSVLEVWCEQE